VIGIWAVVVSGRIFVRSWSLKPRSWWRTFLDDPRGIITVGTKRISVRAVQRRGSRLNDAVSLAYREKYDTPGSVKFVKTGKLKALAVTSAQRSFVFPDLPTIGETIPGFGGVPLAVTPEGFGKLVADESVKDRVGAPV